MMLSAKARAHLRYGGIWTIIGCLLAACVIYLSLTSNTVDLGRRFAHEDKVFHVLAYFTLMAWFGQIYHARCERIILALLFIFMGIMLEYLQSFKPERLAEAADIAANIAGVMLGFYLSLTRAKNILLRLEHWFR